MKHIPPARTPINFTYSPQLHLLYCEQRSLLSKWRAQNIRGGFWRLYWNDRPGAFLYSATARYSIEPGTCTLVAPNTILSSDLAAPTAHFHAHFTAGLPYALLHSCVHQFPVQSWQIAIMRKYYPHYPTSGNTPRQDDPWRVAAVMTLCWHALLTLPQHLSHLMEIEPRLNLLLRWWEAQGWTNLPNSALARQIGMEKTAFCRYFHRLLGQPPHIYGLHKRLDRASIMLRYSTSGIKEIAAAAGFCDHYHFSRTFKRVYKINPSVFRRPAGVLSEN